MMDRDDLAVAVALFAVDPFGLGGMVLRAGVGPHRDQICSWVRSLLSSQGPVLHLPLHITDDGLLGGLSLGATLQRGRAVVEHGLLARANGGVVMVAMAERLGTQVTSHLCVALDRGEIAVERDGIAARVPCRLGIVALDEGIEDEGAPAALCDRLAFRLDLTAPETHARFDDEPDPARVSEARVLLPNVELNGEVIDALCRAAAALGVMSLRAPLLAAAAARAHAALEGRTRVEEADAVVASRLVLGPRANRLPEEVVETEQDRTLGPPEGGESAQPSGADEANHSTPADSVPSGALAEIVLHAAKSAVPAGLLDALALGRERRPVASRAGSAGALRGSTTGGRPCGTRPGQGRCDGRLNLVETLRAAAPKQRLRRRAAENAGGSTRRVEVRKADFRFTRFQQRTETSVIFAVDASGSSALQRLAEAKGAVEQVLADCYVRRDHVALIAFRGAGAALLLPPTRSLTRVRRCLADLAGGGTTPLAAGIDAALALALDARKRGRAPIVVLMTDGRANVARDPKAGTAAAVADAMASARAVRLAGVQTLFLDTAPRPRPQASALASQMAARYLPLPYVDAVAISRQVQSIARDVL
jgi:magnesium chelatase subunit D